MSLLGKMFWKGGGGVYDAADLLDEADLEGAEGIDWHERREPGLGIDFRESIATSMSAIQSTPLTFPVVHGSSVRAQVSVFPIQFTLRSNLIEYWSTQSFITAVIQ